MAFKVSASRFESRSLVDVKRRALVHEIPLTVHLELTYDCDCRCVFCYNSKGRKGSILTAREWDAVLTDLRELGALTVTLTGGDPLAHTEFFALATAVRERAFALRVFTNGWRISNDVARRLADLRPLSVEMSLHGANAETHDRTTGRSGSFAALWQATERLRELNVPVTLKTILTRLNESELDAIVALSGDIPLRIDPAITPCDDGNHGPLRYHASREAIEALMAHLRAVGQIPIARHEPHGYSCGLGRIALTIDPFGAVYPCVQWRVSSLGNVREGRLATIWRHSHVRAQVAEIARMANDRLIAIGGAAARYPFCPAVAALRTGDPLALDSDFLMRAEAAEKARDRG